MGIRLTGALTGVFKGLNDLYDERQAETQKTLAIRTDTAYKNYQKYQEQTLQLKEEVKKRDEEAMGFQNDLTEQERIAVASNPFILETYKKNAGKLNPMTNQQFTLRDYIGKYAPGQTPAGTFKDWMGTIGKQQPVEGQKPTDMGLKEDQRLFGWGVDKQTEQLNKYGQAYGMTAEDIGRFSTTAEAPSISPIAEINKEAIKAPVTREDMARNLFQRYQATKPGSPERENVEIDMAKHKKDMERFDAISGDIDYAKELSNTRAKVYSIIAEPSKHSKADVEWATNWNKADVARVAAAQAAQAQAQRAADSGKGLSDDDILKAMNNQITADIKLIEGERAGVKTYGGKRLEDGGEANVNAAKEKAMKRTLTAIGAIKADGTVEISEKLMQVLRINGLDLVKGDDGKIRFNKPAPENKLDAARKQGPEAVKALIEEARKRGATDEQLKTKFTEEELKLASTTSTPPPPANPTFEQRRQQQIDERAAAAKVKAEAEAKAKEEERKRLLEQRPDVRGLMNRPFMK